MNAPAVQVTADIPKAVVKQSAAADVLHKEIFGDPNAPAANPPAEPVVEATPPAEPTAEATPPAEPPVAAAPPAEPVDSEETWEQRYKSLQGIYKSKMTRYAGQVEDLQGQLENVSQPAPVEPELKTRPEGQKLLNDEEIEDYGADLIDVVKRAAREEFGAELEALRVENTQLKEAVGGVTTSLQHNVRKDLYTMLSGAIPQWRDINGSDSFLYWLEQADPYSGALRQDLLTRAFENNDSERVINFFKGFINENGTVQPTPAAVTESAPSAQVNLQDYVAPGKPAGGTTAQTANPKDERVWTNAEVTAFYSDVQKGKYRLDPDGKNAMEREIIAAANSGRVR